VLGSNQRPWD